MTGTPLQNNVDELFSLLNFLEPVQFPSQAAFLMEFGNLKTEAQVERLQAVSINVYLSTVVSWFCICWGKYEKIDTPERTYPAALYSFFKTAAERIVCLIQAISDEC